MAKRNILITIMVFIGIVLIGLTIYKMKSKDNEINSPKEEIPTIPEKTTYLNNITGKELEEELKKIGYLIKIVLPFSVNCCVVKI